LGGTVEDEGNIHFRSNKALPNTAGVNRMLQSAPKEGGRERKAPIKGVVIQEKRGKVVFWPKVGELRARKETCLRRSKNSGKRILRGFRVNHSRLMSVTGQKTAKEGLPRHTRHEKIRVFLGNEGQIPERSSGKKKKRKDANRQTA